MNLRFKKLCDNAVTPCQAHPTDAGFDLTATSLNIEDGNTLVYGTGIALEIPDGYVGLIFPRSSIAKKEIHLTNCVGVIDSGYRGEIKFKFKALQRCSRPTRWYNRLWLLLSNDYRGKTTTTNILADTPSYYQVGDRIGQLIVLPLLDINMIETDNLSDSDRGNGGYGSTGN